MNSLHNNVFEEENFKKTLNQKSLYTSLKNDNFFEILNTIRFYNDDELNCIFYENHILDGMSNILDTYINTVNEDELENIIF